MRTQIGLEFLPDYREAFSNSLTVQAGTSHVLRGDVEHDAIYVEGELRFATDAPTTLRYVNLHVANGGKLWIGDEANPMLQPVRLIKRDVALDTEKDPFQWGHGIINFGEWISCGKPMERTWVEMVEVEAEATSIVLEFVPAGWAVGDELLIPDTRQMQWAILRAVPHTEGLKQPIRNESPVFIESINGNVVTLSKPLDFEHLAGRWEDGSIAFHPEVANCTRNITFSSENPHGSRGHTATVHTGRQDVRYCAFHDLGRTTGDPLDNSVVVDGVVTHVGANQVGRYAEHRHHAHPHVGTDPAHAHGDHSIGNFYLNTGTAKWANSTHGSHDVHHRDSIAHGFTGAGFVNEDGNETRVTYERCWASGCRGLTELRPTGAKFAFLQKRPGAEGSGFWLHGSDSLVMKNCRAWNNIIGINIFHRSQIGGLVPSVPGGTPDRKHTHIPKEISGNKAISNAMAGFEEWNVPLLPDKSLYLVQQQGSFHNGQTGVVFGNGERGSLEFVGLEALSHAGIGHGVSSSSAYAEYVKVTESRIEGFAKGLGDAMFGVHYDDVTLRNVANVVMGKLRPRVLVLGTINCLPLAGFEPQPCIQAGFELPEPPPPPPVEVWEVADIGPPFDGDAGLRVRAGLIERKQ